MRKTALLLLALSFHAGAAEEPESRETTLQAAFSVAGMKFSGAGQYDVVVASIPDPVRTRLRLETHRTLESIVQAVGQADYLYRGVRLPWILEGDRIRANESDKTELARIGVMLFERRTHQRDLVLLIVGETPSSGVDEEAFRRALALRSYLQSGGDFRMLGPTFSGSYSQVQKLLRESLAADTTGSIVSGMTTSPTERAAAASGWPNMKWLTFGGDHDLSRGAINRYAGCDPSPKRHCDQIAYLTESQTLFGEDAAGQALHLYYPRGISRLRPRSRSLFASRWFHRTPADGQPEGIAADLTGGAAGEDLMPPIAGKQEEDGLIAQLYSLSARLRRERIPNVAVIATDIYDTLFLVRFLRQEVPNVRVFLFDTDTLLLTEVLEYPVEGVISVSRYRVPAPFDNSRGALDLFPSQNAIGQYCAASYLMRPAGPQDDNDTCRAAEWKGVWLQAVSRAGYLPLKLQLKDGETRKPASGGAAPPITDMWVVLALGVYAWALYHLQSVESLRRQLNRDWKVPFDRTWLKSYRTWLDGEAGVRETMTRLIIAAATLIFVALVLVTWPCLTQRQWDLWMAFACIGLILEALILMGAYQIAACLRPRERFWMRVMPLSSAVVLLLALVIEADRAPYTLARLVLPGSGVSLTAPYLALLLLLYAHAYAAMRRLQFHVRRPEVPRFSFLRYRDRWWVTEFLDKHGDESLWWPLLAGFAGVAAAALVQFIPGTGARQLLEGWGFEWLSVGLFGFALGQLVLGVYRFGGLWFLLRRLLDVLEQSRLRQAFTRLPKIYSWSVVWASGGLRQSLFIWTRTLDVGHSLVCSEPADLSPDLRLNLRQAASVLTRQAELLSLYDPKAPDHYGRNGRLRAWQDEIGQHLDPLLEASWRKRTFSDSAEAEGRNLPQLTPFEYFLEEYCALRCVAVIRQAMLHMRNALGVLSLTAALLLAAFSLYAVRSRETVDLTVIPGLAIAGVYIFLVLYQMERHALLCRLSNLKPGEVNKTDFFWRALKFLGAPAALLVLSQFPELNRTVLRWIAPILTELR